jgi:hypothetical protein
VLDVALRRLRDAQENVQAGWGHDISGQLDDWRLVGQIVLVSSQISERLSL